MTGPDDPDRDALDAETDAMLRRCFDPSDGPPPAPLFGPGCLDLARFRQLRAASAVPDEAELAHLAGCRTCYRIFKELREEPAAPPTLPARPVGWARRAAGLLIGLGVVGLSVACALAIQNARNDVQLREVRDIVEARSRAEVEVRALLGRALHRLAVPTQGRRDEAQQILAAVREPLRRLPDGELRDRFAVEIRSAFVATLAVPEARLAEQFKPLPGVFYRVWSVAASPDGRTLILAVPGDGTRLLRWQRGTAPPPLPDIDAGRPRPLLAFSPDGRHLAVAAPDGRLEVWDGDATGPQVELTRAGAAVVAIHFDGAALTVCDAVGVVRAWGVPGFAARPGEWRTEMKPTAAAFGPDGLLAVGDEEGRVRLFRDGEPVRADLRPGKAPIQALAWSSHRRLAVANAEGTHLWTADGMPVQRLRVGSLGQPRLAFHPTEPRYLFVGASSTGCQMWDCETARPVLSLGHHPAGFSADGRAVAATGSTGVAFYDLAIGGPLRELAGHGYGIDKVAWSRDGRRLASQENGNAVRVWAAEDGRVVDAFPVEASQFDHTNAALALSDDGRYVAFASADERSVVLVRDTAERRTSGPWPLPRGFRRLAYAEGRFVLVSEEEADAGPKDWNLRTVVREIVPGQQPSPPREVRPPEPGERLFLTSDLTPDGRLYLWVGPRTPAERRRVEVWEVATGRRRLRIDLGHEDEHRSQPTAVLNPDGTGLWLMDAAGGPARFQPLAGPASPTGRVPRALQPNGGLMVTSLDEGLLQRGGVMVLAGVGDGQPVWLEFYTPDPTAGLTSPAFSPDGRRLAVGNQLGIITLVDLAALRDVVSDFERRLRP